jgi:hypothetical protein
MSSIGVSVIVAGDRLVLTDGSCESWWMGGETVFYLSYPEEEKKKRKTMVAS